MKKKISTHSLTRRLTISLFLRLHFHSISTHSLTRRLTHDMIRASAYADISTHSLTRRLTVRHHARFFQVGHFNSQPHKEADATTPSNRFVASSFQLTASQGG